MCSPFNVSGEKNQFAYALHWLEFTSFDISCATRFLAFAFVISAAQPAKITVPQRSLSSLRPANAVRAYLQNQSNLTGAAIAALGAGETEPAASNDTDAACTTNRRVEIIATP